MVKCVVVDCDFTLWHGAVSEVGAAGIRVESRHVELQERLLALRQAGVLLALCSKNVEADVWAALDADATPRSDPAPTNFIIKNITFAR